MDLKDQKPRNKTAAIPRFPVPGIQVAEMDAIFKGEDLEQASHCVKYNVQYG